MGNEVGLIRKSSAESLSIAKFPSPMGNEVGLMDYMYYMYVLKRTPLICFRPLWGMR